MARPAGPVHLSRRRASARRGAPRSFALPVLAVTALAAAFAVPAAASAAASAHAPAEAAGRPPPPRGHPRVRAGRQAATWAGAAGAWSPPTTRASTPPAARAGSPRRTSCSRPTCSPPSSKSHGYDYVNVDAGWVRRLRRSTAARSPTPPRSPTASRTSATTSTARASSSAPTWPSACTSTPTTTARRPIYGAPGCTTKDIVYPDLRKTNGWDNVSYKIELRQPLRPEVHRLRRRRTRRLGRGLPQGRRRRPGLQPGRRRARQHPRRARRGTPRSSAPAARSSSPCRGRSATRRPPCGSRTPTAGGSTPTSSATATRW